MSRLCHAQVRRWDTHLRAHPPRGVRNIHPAYASLLVNFDPRVRTLAEVEAELRELLATVNPPEPTSSRRVELPTCYGGEFGPDLDEVARLAGMTPGEAAARHAGTEYLVHFLGFSPGFPYLGGPPEALGVARLPSPRTHVPAGSVAIAGGQAGVYPLASPGGWRLLGRTPVRLFDAARAEPALLALGDSVRFVPIAAERYAEIAAAEGARSPAVFTPADGEPAIVVARPGFLTTVQDLGRFHFGHLGVSASGAADPVSLRIGNLLVGNAESAPALEMTLVGGVFAFRRPALVALTGADMQATLDDETLPPALVVAVAPGQTLRCGPARAGARTYLCVRGGISVPAVLGSASTHLASGLGGHAGRALRAGDTLYIGHEPASRPPARGATPEHIACTLLRTTVLRITPGRHADRFEPTQRMALVSTAFAVTEASDRMGLRLRGRALAAPAGGRMLTEGVPLGAIQVPQDGQPIIISVEHQTTGGYPQLASVIAADLHRVGQLRPRDVVRFEWVTFDEAERFFNEQETMIRRWGEDG